MSETQNLTTRPSYYYRESQYRTQCPKHALNGVLHYVTSGDWGTMIRDESTAHAMSKLPLDTFHSILSEYFPTVECKFGKNVGSALRKKHS